VNDTERTIHAGTSGGALGTEGQTAATSTLAATTGATGTAGGLGSGVSGGGATAAGGPDLAPALGTFVEATPTTSGFSSKTEHGLPEVKTIGTAIDSKPTDQVSTGASTGDKSRQTGEPVVPVGVLSGATGAGAGERAFASGSSVPHRMAESDRADSTTSTTAIRHGEPGDRHHKSVLAGVGHESVSQKSEELCASFARWHG
jgi:hypothetical protein